MILSAQTIEKNYTSHIVSTPIKELLTPFEERYKRYRVPYALGLIYLKKHSLDRTLSVRSLRGDDRLYFIDDHLAVIVYSMIAERDAVKILTHQLISLEACYFDDSMMFACSVHRNETIDSADLLNKVSTLFTYGIHYNINRTVIDTLYLDVPYLSAKII